MNNKITQITNQIGEWLENHDEIEQALLEHFKNFHQEPPINRQPAINKIIQHIPTIIMEEHNQMLLRPISL